MTRRRPSSPTRCNITEGTGLSYTLTLAYKHITLHTDTHIIYSHTRSYIHTSTCSHKDPERLCDCGALRRARGERGCRGSSFLPAAVGHAAAGPVSTRGSSGADRTATRDSSRVFLNAVCRQSQDGKRRAANRQPAREDPSPPRLNSRPISSYSQELLSKRLPASSQLSSPLAGQAVVTRQRMGGCCSVVCG